MSFLSFFVYLTSPHHVELLVFHKQSIPEKPRSHSIPFLSKASSSKNIGSRPNQSQSIPGGFLVHAKSLVSML